MLFNSYIFILFFLPVTVMGYFLINKYQKQDNGKWDMWWLFFMSLWFYGYSTPVYLILILVSICVNFFITRRITTERKKERKKKAGTWMAAGIVFNLSLLFYFKYYDFFISNMNTLFHKDWTLKNIALPLGISFFTFQQISYVVDCYREKETIEYEFVEYAAYVTFFPQLVAGPIVMHSELVPQLQDKQKKKINYQNMSEGLYAFALGLGKKVLLADNLSKIVNVGYADVGVLNRISAIVIIISYMFQLYFDFSGYCDMALGMSKMFNIELPINFDSPYKAKSVTDLWGRWHKTLTRFFVQYVYIPLGGSRKGKLCTYRNTMIVFLLSGIWHGANWTFIVWGILQGIFMTLERVLRDVSKKFKIHALDHKIWKNICSIAGVIYTWVFFNFSLVIFRANSLGEAKAFFNRFSVGGKEIASNICDTTAGILEVRILYRLGLGSILNSNSGLVCVGLLILLAIGILFMKNTQEKLETKTYGVMRSLITVFLIVWSVISLSDVSEFLYFNF